MTSNPFLLAADGSDKLLPLLRSNPDLVHDQDAFGYSLLHALTSYNQIEILRTIHQEFKINPKIVDEDGETALFVAETVEAASFLLDELKVDPEHTNNEGQTAEEKIKLEGDHVAVSDYLRETRIRSHGGDDVGREIEGSNRPPRLPDGVKINIGTMQDEDQQEPDPEFRRRIEELASRGDFHDEEGQVQLRNLVRDAVRDVNSSDREVRRRVG